MTQTTNSTASSAPGPEGIHHSYAPLQPLLIIANSVVNAVPPHDIHTEQQREVMVRRYAGIQNLVCDIRAILTWSDVDRRNFLRFCHRLSREAPTTRFVGPSNPVQPNELLQAILAAICPGTNPVALENAIWAATEAASLVYGNAFRPVCNQILDTLRSLGLRGYRIQQLTNHAEAFLCEGNTRDDSPASSLLTEVWPDFADGNEMEIPSGWTLGESGILRAGDSQDHRINIRIAITRRFRDPERDTSLIELQWSRSEDSRWRRRIFPRGVLASTRNIVTLADYDIPVNSNNAADLIDFLDAFEACNMEVIPEAVVRDRMGWIEDTGERGFLVGRHLVAGSQDRESPVDALYQAVEFRGADDGDEQLADSLRPQGEYGNWQNAVGSVWNLPRVMLAIYASFVPPLLTIFRARSFIISFAGPTSGGKTTTLACAAATWGCPDQTVPGSLMMTWDTTRVGIERSMRVLNGIPIVIDDTKQARKPEDVSQAVYDVTGGRGRTRGSEQGLAATATWRTVMITSGEQPMTSFSEDGGTRARILEVWNSPFGCTSAEMAAFVTRLREEFNQNYGHAGPRFVAYLIDQRAQWEVWRNEYNRARLAYEQLAGSNNVASRMAAHVAVLEVGARLVHEALALPWPYETVIRGLWDELTADAAEADRAAVGMRLLLNFCATQRHRFEGGEAANNSSGGIPLQGYIGRWIHHATIGDPHECRVVYVQFVNDLLTSAGFEPQSMKRMWRDRGWTTTNPGKTILKIRVAGMLTDAVAIPLRVIEELSQEGARAAPRPRGFPVDQRPQGTAGTGREHG